MIGILHPSCNSGGGGEKVLWTILESIFKIIDKKELKIKVIIYSGENVDKFTIIDNAKKKFNMKEIEYLSDKIIFKYICDKSIL